MQVLFFRVTFPLPFLHKNKLLTWGYEDPRRLKFWEFCEEIKKSWKKVLTCGAWCGKIAAELGQKQLFPPLDVRDRH